MCRDGIPAHPKEHSVLPSFHQDWVILSPAPLPLPLRRPDHLPAEAAGVPQAGGVVLPVEAAVAAAVVGGNPLITGMNLNAIPVP